jgi:adenylate cyclase
VKPEHEKRHLTTILVADVAGYSGLMAADEAGTFARVKADVRELFEPKAAEYRGRIVKLLGDGVLMEFGSVVDAVRFAADLQRDDAARNAGVPAARRVTYRVGINVGDVIVDGDDIYGDGVNVAARLQEIAEPGAVYVSGHVYGQIEGKVEAGFEDLGDRRLKNIPHPVRVYRLVDGREPSAAVPPRSRRHLPPQARWVAAAAAFALVAAVAAGVAWWRPWAPTASPEPAPGVTAVPPVERAAPGRMAFPLPEKPSIAVLPFDNLSGDAAEDYFADGITDDLITDLSKVSGLFVIARNSVFTYKKKPVKVQQVAEELGVRYVLEGSVRRAEGRIRINAQLTDATTGRHVWAERYDREYKDIFKLQDLVTQQIVEALAVQLSEGEKSRLKTRYTDDLTAHEYYLRGQQTLHSFSISYPEELNTALLMYEEAIKRDAGFARAYIGHALASFYAWRVAYVVPNRSVIAAREQAQDAIMKALALEPKLPSAYTVLALILLADDKTDAAVAAAANAVDLDPNNADSHVAHAYILTKVGRHEEALQIMAKAYRLNPKPPPHYDLFQGKILFDNRRYADAVASLEEGLKRQPRASLFLWYLVPAYAYAGRIEDAKNEALGILGIVPGENLLRLRRIGLYALQRDVEHHVEGFRRAGIPELPYDFQTADANRLGGDEIRAVLFGRTLAATDTKTYQRFVVDRTADGKLTVRGPFGSDVGTSRIVGDQVCERLRSLGNRESCGYVFRTTTGSAERSADYLWVNDRGLYTLSAPN